MKNISLSIVLLLALALTSCSKLNPFQKEKLSVKIDGKNVTWNENQVGATPLADGLLIECIKTSGLNVEQLTIGIGIYTGVGTYTIDSLLGNGNSASYVKTGLSSDISAFSTSGVMEITDVKDEKIEGTLEITMLDTDNNIIEFTNGKFKARIIQ